MKHSMSYLTSRNPTPPTHLPLLQSSYQGFKILVMRISPKYFLILLLIFSTSTLLIAIKKDSATIDQNLRAANRFYTQGSLEEAQLLYRKCLDQDPNQSDCLCNLASLLVDKGYNEEAEQYYRRALDVTDSKHAGALYNLALLLQDSKKDGDLADSKDLYLKLIKIEPDNAEAWANLGAILHQLGELNLAIPSYMRSIELYSIAGPAGEQWITLSSLHENVGRATLRLSEQINDDDELRRDVASKALVHLEKAIYFNPDNEVNSSTFHVYSLIEKRGRGMRFFHGIVNEVVGDGRELFCKKDVSYIISSTKKLVLNGIIAYSFFPFILSFCSSPLRL